MTFAERIRSILGIPEPTPIRSRARTGGVSLEKKQRLTPSASQATRALAGGRLTSDSTEGIFRTVPAVILPPEDAESQWRTGNLDSKTLSSITPARLMELLADLSPEVSKALFDFLRLCNPGWECYVYTLGSDETIDALGQTIVDDFWGLLKSYYGTVDIVFGRIFMGGFMRGAFLAELVLDLAGRMGVDLVTPDPYSVRFRKKIDPARGPINELVQWQDGRLISLDRPTIKYIPIDPFPNSPYGRALATPAIFTALFLLGLLHDLRRVVAQQGYPRLDLSISLERLAATIPANLEDDPNRFNNWMANLVKEVETVYSKLEPDDAYIHTDVVTVNRPVGTVDSDSLGAVGELIRALERMLVRALKTAPFMMASQESQTETQANRVWEAHLQNIKTIQHYVESLIEHMLTILLQASGNQGTVKFRFAENRASEVQRDEMARQLNIANTRAEYDNGWIGQDEAAEKVVGHKPDAPEPRNAQQAAAPAATDPAPGENRSFYESFVRSLGEIGKRREVIASNDEDNDDIPLFIIGELDSAQVEEIHRNRILEWAALLLLSTNAPDNMRAANVEIMRSKLASYGARVSAGTMTIEQFQRMAWNEVYRGTVAAFREGLGRALNDEESGNVQSILESQRSYFDRFVEDIRQAVKDNRALTFVANRASLYKVAAVEAHAKGLLSSADADAEVNWVYGGTIDHCVTCQEKVGRHVVIDLIAGGIFPGVNTECGPSCGCYLELV